MFNIKFETDTTEDNGMESYKCYIALCHMEISEKSTVKEVTVELAALWVSEDVRKIFIGEYGLRF